MITTSLIWPLRPKIIHDPLFDCRRKTWRDKESGYLISWLAILPTEWALHFPKWAGIVPRRFRSLAAAQKFAERHRNGDDDR
jgi:hypothetical protein